MFNGAYKKEAINALNQAAAQYERTREQTIKDTVNLHDFRVKKAIPLLKQIERYIASLAHKPYEYEKMVQTITFRRSNFEKTLHSLEMKSQEIDRVSGSVAGAGVVAGVGVAALGPSVAMATAMTFGTASTGTAIATLSGAAATNAALAWLGGGALSAGGAGMVGGEAFLALAGPVGWVIGGVGLVGSAAYANGKNKEIGQKAQAEARKVKEETEKLTTLDIKVNQLYQLTQRLVSELHPLYMRVSTYRRDYQRLKESQKYQLQKMMNTALALSAKVTEEIK